MRETSITIRTDEAGRRTVSVDATVSSRGEASHIASVLQSAATAAFPPDPLPHFNAAADDSGKIVKQ